jgi:hypothetical protein
LNLRENADGVEDSGKKEMDTRDEMGRTGKRKFMGIRKIEGNKDRNGIDGSLKQTKEEGMGKEGNELQSLNLKFTLRLLM